MEQIEICYAIPRQKATHQCRMRQGSPRGLAVKNHENKNGIDGE
ncbi:hypothetical protein EGJ00_04195 [Pseudomonas saudiphocaensis]|nr:hypothetical protein EGJ00_04195 [Pseudomonas saudiphocaensis]